MIVPMKRLTLIGLKEDESALLQALQAIKAVQILPPEEGRESEPPHGARAVPGRPRPGNHYLSPLFIT